MSDEAESSRAGVRHGHATEATERDDAIADIDEEEEAKHREQIAKERRVDAKRKRILFLDHLLRELDILVFLEFITVYHLDCSFFWFVIRALIHASILTPIPDLGLARQHDEHKPFLILILLSFVVNFLLHLSPAPSAGEDTRGYLHGGLMIDFIGQQGPTSRWKLLGLDICIMVLQTVMVTVHVKRRDLKKKLAKIQGGAGPGSRATEGESSNNTASGEADRTTNENAAREQDADSEERGVLRRTDTLSDIGADPDEEDALLPTSTNESAHADALDILTSGQSVIGDFTLIDTLLQEHGNYKTYRQTRSESAATTGLSPETLRRLHTIRVRFGVGGG